MRPTADIQLLASSGELIASRYFTTNNNGDLELQLRYYRKQELWTVCVCESRTSKAHFLWGTYEKRRPAEIKFLSITM